MAVGARILLVMALISVRSLAATTTATRTTTAPSYPKPRQADVEHSNRRLEEFTAFDPRFKESMAPRVSRFAGLSAQMYLREKLGSDVRLSHQILAEVTWLIEDTAGYARIDRRLDDLKASFAQADQGAVKEQDPTNGSWGPGYTEWWFKLSASFDHFHGKPDIQTTFLDRINSPEKLTEHLTKLSVSDIPRTGVDHYREFNETLSCLQRMLIRGRPKGYKWHPQLKATFMDLIRNKFRDAETGYWGERYVRDGKVVFISDLSITFHTISYFEGDVTDLPKVIDTTLSVKDLDYPVGWLWFGQYWNHNCMDVAELFRLGWPHATDAQKAAMAVEIDKMLQWCLGKSLKADGSFQPIIADGSIEEGTYYGASFLHRIGYFDKSKRFWTDRDFPESEEVRKRIIGFIESRGSAATGGTYYESALDELKP